MQLYNAIHECAHSVLNISLSQASAWSEFFTNMIHLATNCYVKRYPNFFAYSVWLILQKLTDSRSAVSHWLTVGRLSADG